MAVLLDTQRTSVANPGASRLTQLKSQIERAAHLLPAQGPITAFVHHNTLHAFEHLSFEEGIVAGGKIFGCHPFLSDQQFLSELARGRIRPQDLEAVLREDLGDQADQPLLGSTRLSLRMAMLQNAILSAPLHELRWFVAQTDALNQFRKEVTPGIRRRVIEETRHWLMRDVRQQVGDTTKARPAAFLNGLLERICSEPTERWSEKEWESLVVQTLWKTCQRGVEGVRQFAEGSPAIVRHRDLLLDLTGIDADLAVHDILIRFCGAYVDQGLGNSPLPERERGFLAAFKAVYASPSKVYPEWMNQAIGILQRAGDHTNAAIDSIAESLDVLGVPGDELQQFLISTFLALRGWGGMIWQMETRSDRAARAVPPGSLIGFLAVRLILERCILQAIAQSQLGWHNPVEGLLAELHARTPRQHGPSLEQRAFHVFQVAQLLGWSPEELVGLQRDDWTLLVGEIEGFSSLERRRVYQLAFERRYRNQALDAITVRSSLPRTPRTTPDLQAVFCLDEREESFRRWMEELSPSVETFGAAGFFGVAMYYRGLTDAHFTPLCPIIVRPQHYVREEVVETFERLNQRRSRQRQVLGSVARRFHLGSRSSAIGALLTAFLGPLASAPLVGRVLFPRLAGRIRSRASSLVQPPEATRLKLQRVDATPGPDGDHVGFSLEEMTNIAERILRDMGFTSHFARLIVILGHGSSSFNNPHKAAYDCGACAGSVGGPNARALARILNTPEIRQGLSTRGISIPDESVFVGGWHNTCDDSVSLDDVDSIPASHSTDFNDALSLLEETCRRNAHERCRRFDSAPLDISFKDAQRHVQARSEDLAQTRPELGHATNALTIVGRRSRTRGLFLDRRAFLTSYDPEQDTPDSAILLRVLSAVVPVCAGINLEYYFSHVDPVGFGCGTKLPHNVVSLLGVMDGPTSDLRTGLPWQMVEIHEPIRSLFIIETTPERMQRIMEESAEIKRLCGNGWVQLALLDPASDRIHLFKQGRFELYVPETRELKTVASSVDWYRGWRDHLGFAMVKNCLTGAASAQDGHAR
jgi:uncharacterized protein